MAIEKKYQFKGKSKWNGEEVTGDLIHGADGETYIGTINVFADMTSEDVNLDEVYPESVELLIKNSYLRKLLK